MGVRKPSHSILVQTKIEISGPRFVVKGQGLKVKIKKKTCAHFMIKNWSD